MRQKSGSLNDDPDVRREVSLPSHLFVVDENGAAVRSEEAADAFHQHRLAGAVVADDPVDLPLFKGVGYIFQDVFFSEIFIDAVDLDHVLQVYPSVPVKLKLYRLAAQMAAK